MISSDGVSRPERRWLITQDGVRIHAELHPATDPRPTGTGLVIVHGFSAGTHRPANIHVVDQLTRTLPAIAIDLRGHGRSEGVCSLGDTEVLDVVAAVRWARMQGWRRVVTVGFSMGASIVVRHAGLHHDVDAVVAVSGPAFWSYRGTPIMRRLHFGVEHPVGRAFVHNVLRTRVMSPPWPEPWPLSPAELAAGIPPIPFLVVHGTQDGFFPDEHPRALVNAAAAGAAAAGLTGYQPELWLEPFGHAEAAIPDELLDRIADWAVDPAG